MTLNCAIIDDEPLALEMMSGYVQKTPFLTLSGAYGSAVQAIKSLRDNPVDLLFLDIQMPELSGLEFAKVLPKQTKVVFTTAFPQYAVDGYEVEALGYILKPISYDAFQKVAKRAYEWFTQSEKAKNYAKDRFIFVKSDYKLVRIDLDDILYIEGLKDYVRIYTENGDKIMSLMNMKTLEDFLPKPEFLRSHRSYIVHMNKVKCLDRFRMNIGENYITVSERYKETILTYFANHTIS